MATTIRQPFAPLNSSRLQSLTSLKNRQNAISLTSSTKRKATAFDDDAENIDPVIFFSPKKSKGADSSSSTMSKPTNFFLTKAPPSPDASAFCNLKPVTSPARKPLLPSRSPAPKLETTTKSPLTAPAGRSPTRKRIGILHRRRTTGAFTRIDPPRFSTPSSSLGFSIDAALSGTIPSYKSPAPAPAPAPITQTLDIPELYVAPSKDSWFFAIHEDTEEELATNLMEHGACTLDISSDEESAQREKWERGKENVPPMDDISQTRTTLSDPVAAIEASMGEVKARARAVRRRKEIDDGACDIDRAPLGEMAAEDFYAEGCDGSSVFFVPTEEEAAEAETATETEDPSRRTAPTFDFAVEGKDKRKEVEVDVDVDELMRKDSFEMAPKAALLDPIEKAEDNFELWESGSAKDGE